ncbi:uncharacterized protein LOC123552423 isoform X2 [Mercenaria mercenaria]|uniref:uncharacterized protein LOC123552423 isoform X2 n=1 Tax=Mercenaria mercenaria TaxID=6596 RepID=UPI00234F6D04|nr:uncharacterized protein LOC123552423 isoform X2 [Mercenaria mercenaria]
MAASIPCNDMTETNDGNGQVSTGRSQFMEPPSDWAFNNLVTHIRQNLDANDINKIKLRFKVEGHGYVRIHVKSGRCVTEDHLYSIRNTISEALFIPMEDIMVAGIEEANSVYLTLMLPEFFIEVLRQILENPRSRNILGPLGRLGIDKMILPPGSTFSVDTDDETLHSGNIIHQLQLELQQKTYQMKELENEILKIKRNNFKVVPNGKKVKKRSYAFLKRVRPKLVPKRNNDDTLTQ